MRRHLASLRSHEREELKLQAREKISQASLLTVTLTCPNVLHISNLNSPTHVKRKYVARWVRDFASRRLHLTHHITLQLHFHPCTNLRLKLEMKHQTHHLTDATNSYCSHNSNVQDITARKRQRETKERLALAVQEVCRENIAPYFPHFFVCKIPYSNTDLHRHVPEG